MLELSVSTRESGRRRTVRVLIYDELADLRAAAARHVRRVEDTEEPDDFSEALAVAHSFETYRYADDGAEVRGTAAGIIRYHRGHLGTSVVVHEAVHIALGIYRQDWQPDHGPIDAGMDNEELLCRLVHDLTRRIVDRLYARDVYSRADLT